MQCKIKRTIFDLFTYYDCNECIYKKANEHFNYIESSFHIYYLFSSCEVSRDSEELIFNDITIKKFIYDAIYYGQKIIFILIEDKEINDVFNYLDLLDNFNSDIQIIIL